MRKVTAAIPVAILLLCGTSQVRADVCNAFANNLVSNCGFESGSFSSWTGTALTAGVNYAGIDNGDPFTTSPTPYNGNFEAYLGYPSSTITLTQTLATTAGASYLVEFALLNDTAPSLGYTNSFLATFGSGSYSLSALNAGAYTLYSFLGTAGSASTPITFTSRNDGGFFELDSVSVTAATTAAATPEPSSWMLLGTGVLGLAGAMRRKLTA